MHTSNAQYAWQELAPPPIVFHRLAALKQSMGVLAEHILDILSRKPPHSPPFEGQDLLVDHEGDLVLPFRRGHGTKGCAGFPNQYTMLRAVT